LNPAQRFQRIRDTNLWGAAASASGLGSEMNATTVLRAELTRLLKRLGVVSLLDAPCGDAGWINQADLDVRYAGVDIVPSLIEALQGARRRGRNRWRISSRGYHQGFAAPMRCDQSAFGGPDDKLRDEAIQLCFALSGLLRGACHRARIRATRWLAMTLEQSPSEKTDAGGYGSRRSPGRR
jgi:hypothetical protein